MEYRDKLIHDLAERECKRICRVTILALQRIKDCMLSGDDTILQNTWDEICVQMQSQESFAWEAYLDTIKPIISYEVERLKRPEQEAIWLQTPQGSDWEIEQEETPDTVAICIDDIADHILHEFVLRAASDWKNKRIEKYLEREY